MTLPGTRYAYYYTSKDEGINMLSEDGLLNHTDDFFDDEELVQQYVERATGRVKAIMRKAFDDVDLANSPFVREKATIIFCYLISIRRGNPSLYQEQYIEAIEDLKDVVDGTLYLDELPRSSNAAAYMQNVSSDNRNSWTPIRVDPISSTKLTGKEFIQRVSPFTWL